MRLSEVILVSGETKAVVSRQGLMLRIWEAFGADVVCVVVGSLVGPVDGFAGGYTGSIKHKCISNPHKVLVGTAYCFPTPA